MFLRINCVYKWGFLSCFRKKQFLLTRITCCMLYSVLPRNLSVALSDLKVLWKILMISLKITGDKNSLMVLCRRQRIAISVVTMTGFWTPNLLQVRVLSLIHHIYDIWPSASYNTVGCNCLSMYNSISK